MRVLVVEDEPALARFIKQGLGEAGYAVDVGLPLARDDRAELDAHARIS